MTSPELNAIGLISNIFGVILIFFFGLPQPSHDEGVSLGLEENTRLNDGTTVKQRNLKIKRRRLIYKFFACLALVLMLMGFALQFLSIIPDLQNLSGS
ncbi:hypothetical protein HUZ94_17105 [Cronobacter sakazakii]|uniref:hypothetical protein n=1 Tax=Cronobacter sakazakii TaxID=28141 RepID=UPI0015881CDB|nr:hypothetical protein [Cronobacter sakazakii]NUW65316.1 hypothetical protein [Cronobacter sakazakii]